MTNPIEDFVTHSGTSCTTSDREPPFRPLQTRCAIAVVWQVFIDEKWRPHTTGQAQQLMKTSHGSSIGNLRYKLGRYNKEDSNVQILKWKTTQGYLIPDANVFFGTSAKTTEDREVSSSCFFRAKCYKIENNTIVATINQYVFQHYSHLKKQEKNNLYNAAAEMVLKEKVTNFKAAVPQLTKTLSAEKYDSIPEATLKKRISKALNALHNNITTTSSSSTEHIGDEFITEVIKRDFRTSLDSSPFRPLRNQTPVVVYLQKYVNNCWEQHTPKNDNTQPSVLSSFGKEFSGYRIGELYVKGKKKRPEKDVGVYALRYKTNWFYKFSTTNLHFGTNAALSGAHIFRIRCYKTNGSRIVSRYNRIIFQNALAGAQRKAKFIKIASTILKRPITTMTLEGTSEEMKGILSKKPSSLADVELERQITIALQIDDATKEIEELEKQIAQQNQEITTLTTQLEEMREINSLLRETLKESDAQINGNQQNTGPRRQREPSERNEGQEPVRERTRVTPEGNVPESSTEEIREYSLSELENTSTDTLLTQLELRKKQLQKTIEENRKTLATLQKRKTNLKKTSSSLLRKTNPRVSQVDRPDRNNPLQEDSPSPIATDLNTFDFSDPEDDNEMGGINIESMDEEEPLSKQASPDDLSEGEELSGINIESMDEEEPFSKQASPDVSPESIENALSFEAMYNEIDITEIDRGTETPASEVDTGHVFLENQLNEMLENIIRRCNVLQQEVLQGNQLLEDLKMRNSEQLTRTEQLKKNVASLKKKISKLTNEKGYVSDQYAHLKNKYKSLKKKRRKASA